MELEGDRETRRNIKMMKRETEIKIDKIERES